MKFKPKLYLKFAVLILTVLAVIFIYIDYYRFAYALGDKAYLTRLEGGAVSRSYFRYCKGRMQDKKYGMIIEKDLAVNLNDYPYVRELKLESSFSSVGLSQLIFSPYLEGINFNPSQKISGLDKIKLEADLKWFSVTHSMVDMEELRIFCDNNKIKILYIYGIEIMYVEEMKRIDSLKCGEVVFLK